MSNRIQLKHEADQLFPQTNCRVTHCGQLGRKRNNEERRLFFPIFANVTVQIQLESPLSPTLAFQYEHAICCKKKHSQRLNMRKLGFWVTSKSWWCVWPVIIISIPWFVCFPFFPPANSWINILQASIWGPDHIYGWFFARSPYPTWRNPWDFLVTQSQLSLVLQLLFV